MRTIRLHDTLRGAVTTLEPREPGKVGIYACGPTVYGRVHVGTRARSSCSPCSSASSSTRATRRRFVANITDVNDKIYDAARERGVASAELAREMTDAYIADTDGLGLGRPDSEPLATETIGPIVELIEALVESGHAYEARGDVYFRVASYPDYGKLSNRPLEEMQQGEGDDAAEVKEAPQDFALWKARKEGEDTFWESPWGEGRPGWHIECSAMAEEILGVDFEIHGGGIGPRLPAPRERDRPDRGGARAGRSRASGCTTAWSRWATRRWRSRSATSGCCTARSKSSGAKHS